MADQRVGATAATRCNPKLRDTQTDVEGLKVRASLNTRTNNQHGPLPPLPRPLRSHQRDRCGSARCDSWAIKKEQTLPAMGVKDQYITMNRWQSS